MRMLAAEVRRRVEEAREVSRSSRRSVARAGARLHSLHGPGAAPWIVGGFEDTINEFLTYREALMLRLRLTLLAGRPDLPVHLEHARSAPKGSLLTVENGQMVSEAGATSSVRIPLLMSDVVYEAVPAESSHLGDYILALAPRLGHGSLAGAGSV
eukprot:Skav221872  [mRNA]  locus=scaffold1395:179825:188514:+ [translate_table: standard]